MAAGDPAGKPEEGLRVKGRLNLSIVRGVVRPCRSLITLVPCREQLGGEYTNRECPGVCRDLPWLVGFIISWGIFLNSHHTYLSQVKIWGLRGQGACSESPRDRRHTKAQDWWPCLQLSLYQSWHYFGFPPGLGSGWNWVKVQHAESGSGSHKRVSEQWVGQVSGFYFSSSLKTFPSLHLHKSLCQLSVKIFHL